MGLCIKELERIYGVRDGSAGQSEPKLSGGDVLYQSDIAKMIGERDKDIDKTTNLMYSDNRK